MKVAALIDENGNMGRQGNFPEMSFYQKIKAQRNADALIVVTVGGFGQDGIPAKTDKYRKAERMRHEGADLVLELPVYCVLTTFDTFAFAAVSMLEKLNCVDELIVFTENADPKLLSEVVQFLFIESKDYQDTFKKYCAEGLDFTEAQAAAAEHWICGAGNVLRSTLNRKAVEYAKAMKRMYSTMKICFCECDMGNNSVYDQDGKNFADACKVDEDSVKWNSRISRSLALQFYGMIEAIPESRREKYLNEISGGYAPETRRLLSAYQEQSEDDFERFAETLAADGRTLDDVKRYLMRAILGIRQVDISICGLYSYALYARALGMYEHVPLFEQMKEASWIPVFSEENPEDKAAAGAAANMDDSGRILLQIDRRAEELHRQLLRFFKS